MFVAYDEDKMYTYVYYRDTVEGRCLLQWWLLTGGYQFRTIMCICWKHQVTLRAETVDALQWRNVLSDTKWKGI